LNEPWQNTEEVKTEPFKRQSNGKCRHITNKPEKEGAGRVADP